MHTYFLTAGALVLLAGASAFAGTLPGWNFDSSPAGSAPVAADIWIDPSPGNTVIITGTATQPADPFAKGRNQSLHVSHAADSKKAAQIQFSLPSDISPLVKGSVSFDLYVAGTGETPGLIEINLGMLEKDGRSQRSRSLSAIQIWTNSATTTTSTRNPPGYFVSFSNGISGSENLSAFNEQVPVNKPANISVSWDALNGTYAVSINGHACTRGRGTSILNRFPATQPSTGVVAVRFKSANNAATSFYIDNIAFREDAAAAQTPNP